MFLEESMKLKPIFASVVVLSSLATLALAQSLSASEVLTKLETVQKSLKDYKAKAVGIISDDTQKIKLDLDVQAIPALKLTRLTFNAPDTLADNVSIIDNDNFYNYLFLTNQVTITKIGKAQVGGVSFGNIGSFGDLQSSIPKEKLDFKPVTMEDTPNGKAYVIDATPKKGIDLAFGRVKIWALEKSFNLYHVQYFNEKGAMQADLTIPEFKSNVGLKAKDLCKLPSDVEKIVKDKLKKFSCEVK
jgi:outer membrane lipoprotein-sorting protein